jgi:hypothetical protein
MGAPTRRDKRAKPARQAPVTLGRSPGQLGDAGADAAASTRTIWLIDSLFNKLPNDLSVPKQ